MNIGSPNEKNPFLSERSLYLIKPLDLGLFNYGAGIYWLVGKIFHHFVKPNLMLKIRFVLSQSQFVTELKTCMFFKIKSNRFLHNMVRSIVGTLIEFFLTKK